MRQMGFCHINNICVAAQIALSEFSLKRVLIFDWDVHHGNGTQEIFEGRKDVLFMSIHRHDNGYFYPQGQKGAEFQIGEGEGKGYSVNMPLTGEKHGDYQ